MSKSPILLIPLLAALALLPGDRRPSVPEARAQPSPALVPSLDVPLEVKGDTVKVQVDKVIVVKEDRLLVRSLPFTVQAPPGAGLYFWQFPQGVTALDKGDRLEVTAAPKGALFIGVKLVTADWDKKQFLTKFGSVSLDVGEVTPVPIPPGPEPKPTPPEPKPDPVPVGGLRVIFVRETSDPLTAEQTHAFNSTRIAALLNAKTEKLGSQPEWRKWDKDTDKTYEKSKALKDIWEAAKAEASASLPALIVANGTVITVYPLTNEEDAIRIIEKHAQGS